MDSGFGEGGDRYFDAVQNRQKRDEVDTLIKENRRLLDLLSHMQKDGYTYDQLNRKMIVCELCGERIKDD